MSILKIIPTIPDVIDSVGCFIGGHDWVKVRQGDRYVVVCRDCGAVR